MYKWKLHFSLDNNSPNVNQVDDNGQLSYSGNTSITSASSVAISIYPNPAKNILRVEGLNSSANTKLSVIDASGKLMKQVNTQSINYNYDLENLSAGIYYLKIETDKKVTNLKFIKE